MESPWYKCCVWTGLGWGLLVYYSRDTASRMKTTHFKKYLHLHGIIVCEADLYILMLYVVC